MKKNVYIDGMSCKNCVRHVKEALNEVEGLTVLDVNLKKGIAIVEGESLSDQAIIDAIGNTHYTFKKIENV